jgi:hypothetical protein
MNIPNKGKNNANELLGTKDKILFFTILSDNKSRLLQIQKIKGT